MWKSIIVVKPEATWKFTPEINEGIYFRFRHINPPASPEGWLAQVEPIPNTNFHLFYHPQRINGLSVFELVELHKPPIFISRKLAFRQRTKIPNDWLIEVEVYMSPVVDLNPEQSPINPGISTVKVPSSVTMNGTTPVRLLPANTNNSRNGATFYNPSTTRNLIIDTDATVNTASAVARVAPGKLYISDFPEWQGEYWGVFDGAGTTAIGVEEYLQK